LTMREIFDGTKMDGAEIMSYIGVSMQAEGSKQLTTEMVRFICAGGDNHPVVVWGPECPLDKTAGQRLTRAEAIELMDIRVILFRSLARPEAMRMEAALQEYVLYTLEAPLGPRLFRKVDYSLYAGPKSKSWTKRRPNYEGELDKVFLSASSTLAAGLTSGKYQLVRGPHDNDEQIKLPADFQERVEAAGEWPVYVRNDDSDSESDSE